KIRNALCIAGQHRGLIDHANSLEIFFYLKTIRILPLEFIVKQERQFFAFYVFSQFYCLLHIFYYHGRGMCSGAGKRSPCFLMLWFTMNNNCIIIFGNELAAIPNFFYKRAGGL